MVKAMLDLAQYRIGRLLCYLKLHNTSCRGRSDHSPDAGHWTTSW